MRPLEPKAPQNVFDGHEIAEISKLGMRIVCQERAGCDETRKASELNSTALVMHSETLGHCTARMPTPRAY
jgi:hypothetical protein